MAQFGLLAVQASGQTQPVEIQFLLAPELRSITVSPEKRIRQRVAACLRW
ncbi:hypothetical protein [Accumulibacter sp.]|nr:hypothetical protein [Accumulibacter sp.]MDS4054427.1 hypothetical protein [Accumulibacter sp.]HNB68380.1 hypothetical protein [Accumulibacter sp.]HNG87441.1 hypothetical protein [Accumulibacter sp.]